MIKCFSKIGILKDVKEKLYLILKSDFKKDSYTKMQIDFQFKDQWAFFKKRFPE